MFVFVEMQVAFGFLSFPRSTPSADVNSVMMSPHPLRFRMKRRNTVSVTPAMGASTVAGAISTPPMERRGATRLDPRTELSPAPSKARETAGFSKYLRTGLF